MVHRVLKIGRWVVDFLFATKGYDIDGVLSVMYDCGASGYAMEQAEDLMTLCDNNCGFTFTNPARMRAVIVIGPTTSGAEFQDTLIHEIHHLAVAIADNLGIDLKGEGPAYLSGDTARALARVLCEFGCEHCH